MTKTFHAPFIPRLSYTDFKLHACSFSVLCLACFLVAYGWLKKSPFFANNANEIEIPSLTDGAATENAADVNIKNKDGQSKMRMPRVQLGLPYRYLNNIYAANADLANLKQVEKKMHKSPKSSTN